MQKQFNGNQLTRIGIDFGTTHTSAALYDGKQIHPIPLDLMNDNPNLLRSMIYVNREQKVHLGLDAVKTFLAQDTGREVVFEEKVVGTITNTVASHDAQENVTIIYDTFIEEDVGIRGRLLQSIKTGLRGDSYKGTKIFGQYYTLQELIALILRHVRQQASAHLGQEVTAATLGRPVQFVEDPAADQRAERRLREAAEQAGFTDINFVPEPVAAASFYLAQVTAPETVLIFDFGGGTLDLTLLRTDGAGNHEILATHGVLVGGDDLDSEIMRHIVAPHFGSESPIDINFDDQPIPFPEDLAENLYLWQSIPNLSRPQALKVLERALRYSPEQEKFVALEALVTRNHGFALFEQIEQAKRRLTAAEETMLRMQVEAIDLAVLLRRKRFNRAIGDEISDARLGVRTILAEAGLEAAGVDAVVTTGGSSVIPIFQKMLTDEFPTATLVPLDTFSGVTSGLAIRAYETNAKR
ncbi:MAG: Hsp70 family protein [Caldilineaceae bacterium]|nr:Hsp70 family protein [Caldilineaceae bacterium]